MMVFSMLLYIYITLAFFVYYFHLLTHILTEPLLMGACFYDLADLSVFCNTTLDRTQVELEYLCSYDSGPVESCNNCSSLLLHVYYIIFPYAELGFQNIAWKFG